MVVKTYSVNDLEQLYLDKEVHVIYNENGVEIDTRGVVTGVTPNGKLIGTWGEHKITIGEDYVSLYD